MPKRKSTSRFDLIQNSRRAALASVEQHTEKLSRSLISQVMAEMGRKGGKIGGKRRLDTLSARRRTQIAREAAKARWAKRKRTDPAA